MSCLRPQRSNNLLISTMHIPLTNRITDGNVADRACRRYRSFVAGSSIVLASTYLYGRKPKTE